MVIPKSTKEDVIAVVEAANRLRRPGAAKRGGGTSLAGQTVNQAIVIDFSKYMREPHRGEPRGGLGPRTQPGIILDELNRPVWRPTGMLFAPDPSTSNRGNVGGALGNNSCAARIRSCGERPVDNVLEMDAVLSNGTTRLASARLDGGQLEAKMRVEGPWKGDIYSTPVRHRRGERETRYWRGYPRIQRRVSGYNLDEFVGGSDFDMARFVVGSEGTLTTITEAKLRPGTPSKGEGAGRAALRET